MRRRIIKQGIGGYTVYLPKKWADAHKLQEEVDIEPAGDLLVISAAGKEQKTTTQLKLHNKTESAIRTLITNTYRSGSDIITVQFDNKEQLRILKDVVATRLLGFEITKTGEKSCIVESVTEPAAEQFDTILKKFLFSISELLDMAKDHFDGRIVDYEEVEGRIQRYDNFCRRILAKQKIRRKNSEMLWTFLALMLHAQRDVYHLMNNQKRLGTKGVTLLKEAAQLFQLIKQTYLENNITLLSDVHEQFQALLRKNLKMLETLRGKDAVAAHFLMSSMRGFYLANSPLAGYLV